MTGKRALVLILIAALALTAGCLGAQNKKPPVGAGDSEPSPTSTQTDPVFDQTSKTYKLAPVAAPSGGATAWAEVDGAAYEEGMSPFKVVYHARLDDIDLVTEAEYSTAEDAVQITWIDATTVLMGRRWLADLSGAGRLTLLPDYAWSHRLSPDRTKIAFWGRLNPDDTSDTAMGPQIYDLATGQIRVIKTFTTEDWGYEGEIGILPLVAWLDGNTLLFDGPRPGLTSVFKHNLATGKTDLWREDGWHVFASGDGKYAAVAHPNASGEYASFIIDLQSGVETELPAEKYGYPTWVTWVGDEFAVYNQHAVGIGRMTGGKPVFVREATGDSIISVRQVAGKVSFVEVKIVNGEVDGMDQVELVLAQ
ncbi:MAG: TolB family protein [Chloroflexota bacterium]